MGFRIGEADLSIRMSAGECLLNGGYPVEALPYIERDCKLQPENPGHWNNLANCWKYLGDYEKALAANIECLRLAPDVPQAKHNRALILDELGRFDESFTWWARASCVSSNENTQFGLATAMLRRRKYDLAVPLWEASRLGKKSACFVPNVEVWRGQDLAGKRILVTREGGQGDIFWLARYIPLLKELGAHVTFHVFRSQKEFFTAYDWADRVLSAEDEIEPAEHDYQVPLWSVPWELRKLGREVPYMPDGPYLSARNPVEHPPLTVGLCFTAGELTSVHRKMRVIQDEYLGAFASVPVNWVSLVPGNKPDWCSAVCPMGWVETADFIAGCDLVISADTACAHLAAAMGKATWTYVPIQTAWFFWDEADRGFTSWYPTMRVFKNSEPVSFEPVVMKIVAELKAWAEAKKRESNPLAGQLRRMVLREVVTA